MEKFEFRWHLRRLAAGAFAYDFEEHIFVNYFGLILKYTDFICRYKELYSVKIPWCGSSYAFLCLAGGHAPVFARER